MMTRCRHVAIVSSVLLLAAATVWAESPSVANDQIDVGIFTAVEGKVIVTHPGLRKALPAKLQEGVLFKDVIETDKESRTKALLNDDSILTVGEHSRVEVTEHIYDPNKDVRSVVVSLVKGKVRALVGRVFKGSGSKFEIHTPTAVAAARGTYFVVWHVNGSSGIANIGRHGEVGFSSGGQTVTVAPGSFSISPPGGGPPVPPAPLTGGNTPAQVTAAVQGTSLPDAPESENPSRAAAASGGTAPVQSPPSNANVPASTSGAFTGTAPSSTPGTLPPPTGGTTPPIVTSDPKVVEQVSPPPPPPGPTPPPPPGPTPPPPPGPTPPPPPGPTPPPPPGPTPPPPPGPTPPPPPPTLPPGHGGENPCQGNCGGSQGGGVGVGEKPNPGGQGSGGSSQVTPPPPPPPKPPKVTPPAGPPATPPGKNK
jgi:FecR-like protein